MHVQVPLKKPPIQATSTSKSTAIRGRPPKWKKIPVKDFKELEELKTKQVSRPKTMPASEPSSKHSSTSESSSRSTSFQEPIGEQDEESLSEAESYQEPPRKKFSTSGGDAKPRSNASGGVSKRASVIPEAYGERIRIADLEKIVDILERRKQAPKPRDEDTSEESEDYEPPRKRSQSFHIPAYVPPPIAPVIKPTAPKVDKYAYAFKG